jgi:hypothetical protein
VINAFAAAAVFLAALNAINAQGPFPDGAVWIYETPQHTFGFTSLHKGTNEKIDVLPPDVPAGTKPASVELLRHQMDFEGYPLHISLVDKLFAQKEGVQITTSMGNDRREYDPGTSFGQEKILSGSGTQTFTLIGPMPADGQIPAVYQEAFSYVKSVLGQLNLPSQQKELANYGVMFVDTKDTTWVELAPVWGDDETPHLGCQTALGRDMVFGYRKNLPGGKTGGALLQCM